MATIKIDLSDNLWHEIGTIGFIYTKMGNQIEFINIGSQPTGDVPEAMILERTEEHYMPAPVNGSYYVRSKSGSGSFRYHEV